MGNEEMRSEPTSYIDTSGRHYIVCILASNILSIQLQLNLNSNDTLRQEPCYK